MRLAPFAQRLLFVAGGKPVVPGLTRTGLTFQPEARQWHLFQRLPDVIRNVGRHPELCPRSGDAGQWKQVVWRHEAAAVVAGLGPGVGIVEEDPGQATIGQDVEQVAEICSRVEENGKLDRIGVDPHGLGGILDALAAAGIDTGPGKVVGISQGWKLTGAIKTTERRLAEGAMWHGGSRMMAWCVGNAKVEPQGNAVAITKQAAGFAKIDPLMAVFNAVSLMSLNPQSAAAPGVILL